MMTSYSTNCLLCNNIFLDAFIQQFRKYLLFQYSRDLRHIIEKGQHIHAIKGTFPSIISHIPLAPVLSDYNTTSTNSIHTQLPNPTPQMIHPGTSFSPRAAHMTEEHIEAVRETLAAGFLEKNEIWSAFGIKKRDILSFFDRVIRNHLAAEQRVCAGSCLNIVAINNGRVVGCKLHYDLQTYLHMHAIEVDQKCQDFKLFECLQKAGTELTKDLDFSLYPKGRTAFINFGGYHPESNLSNLLKVIFFTQINQRLKQSGFDWVVGRLSNARAMGLYKKFGAKILNQIDFELKGRTFRLYFIQMSLHSEVFCRWEENLQKMIELERNNLKHSKL